MTARHQLSAWGDFRSGLHRSPSELEQLQLSRLRALVTFAYARVPYYRNLFDSVGFHPRHLKRLTDIEAIPVTTRASLQSSPVESLIARGVRLDRLRATRTAGSSGTPLTAYKSQQESRIGLSLRLRTWFHHGLRWNDHVLTIHGRSSTVGKRVWMRRIPLPWRWNLSMDDDPETLMHALVSLKPSVLYGYSLRVATMASLARAREIEKGFLRMVATSGDMLLPRFRALIQETWNIDPIDIYSSSELGNIAWQCEQREGFHINADHSLVELLRNNRPVMEGDSGEVIVTSLYRYSMPLIRYSTADLAVPRPAPCVCGITLPMLHSLEGRTLDVVPLPNGRMFVGFNRFLCAVQEIDKFQVVQRALDDFLIMVVPGKNYSPEIAGKVENDLQPFLGRDVTIVIQPVAASEFIQTSRKDRPVIPFARVDLGNEMG